MYAEERIKAEIRKEALEEAVKPSQRKEMARAIERHGISIRLACICLGISESCYHYQCKFSDENAVIADWLLRLMRLRSAGDRLMLLSPTQREAFRGIINGYPIYRELELNLRIKPKRRIKRDKPDALRTNSQKSGLVDGFYVRQLS